MQLGTIRTPDGRSHAVVRDGEEWVILAVSDVGALIADADWRERATTTAADASAPRVPLHEADLIRPLLSPGKIVCCGLNYRDHIVETGRAVPQFPTLFAKFADTLTDPTAAIEISDSEKIDWEAELAVVIGAEVRRADADEAAEAILGYTVSNDVSLRDWQSRTLQWFQGKAWDRTTPIGPVIVTADAIDPRAGLAIRTAIGDEIVQDSNTRELVFDAPALVSYVSQFTALRAGDLILTGTPGGVGLGREPQRWLSDGDVLITSIEGIGELRNPIRVPPVSTGASA